jgi:hypothetical protein
MTLSQPRAEAMAIIGGLQGMIHTIENTSVNNIWLKKFIHFYLGPR